jgi:hypothetical protein
MFWNHGGALCIVEGYPRRVMNGGQNCNHEGEGCDCRRRATQRERCQVGRRGSSRRSREGCGTNRAGIDGQRTRSGAGKDQAVDAGDETGCRQSGHGGSKQAGPTKGRRKKKENDRTAQTKNRTRVSPIAAARQILTSGRTNQAFVQHQRDATIGAARAFLD